ncbi:eukaryotic translation initiation factor 2 subunit beta, putative [Plasmodium ovale]|uniref:Eukaryotic translation initiation factor 2 beta subunit, putative n=2 Tax=Plasmodium ovale TaxID=36330 RepID=A0A1A8W4C3_PLAOA|nr:eukaryotic translation initiation factor 2 beta subunit, putative [Plasmodium ovale curtisi]SBS82757.1 eukaryotic translation initiation factor 2 beta subunit, putative [Plasmodium ovale curtisi]SBS87771.1 eukaryotic translation initiation factor 2 beta subunit, putative [Plasmodium ovale curtisi]SCP04095.1 eukaryotic translation initiation factor 2 subunit beta, putative [Plasmodium ovale]
MEEKVEDKVDEKVEDAGAVFVDLDKVNDETKQLFDFGEKKKKKKKKEAAEKVEEVIIDGTGKIFERGEVYKYEELLHRIQELVNKHNIDLCISKKYTIKPPQVVRVGSKKVAWINFKDICTIMNRNEEHVFHFVLAELGTEGSIAGEGQLVLKGKYGPKHIEALLRKYITEYVTCQMCKSPNTAMEKDSRTRLFHQHCNACGAMRSVTTIKSGFHALGRGERRKAKHIN